jgi:glycosyltransferase involved in cell wall biosynthesis
MNLWLQEFDSVTIIAPVVNSNHIDPIDVPFNCKHVGHIKLFSFSMVGPIALLHTLFVVPLNAIIIYLSMFLSGHLHVRSPGNIGLLASMIQVLFPWKRKSFKYAGNWVENIGQPVSYRIQKWIMANCFMTRNSTALVYGKRPADHKCVTDAFTATYNVEDAKPITVRTIHAGRPIHMVFAGSLIAGKNPLIAIDVCRILNDQGLIAFLTICGNGPLRQIVTNYISDKSLEGRIICKGNLNRKELDSVFQSSHFLLMPSQSEGWPKSVAEAMWWGTLPVVSPVSCVPEMLAHGARGILVPPNAIKIAEAIASLVNQPDHYQSMCVKAMEWSRVYTLESFRKLIESVPKA